MNKPASNVSTKLPVVFSGIQPSGVINIGGYLGAIRNWISLQNDHDCIFSLVDLHSITIRQDPQQLRANLYDLLALYLACGIDPDKSIIFCQSHVPEHAELAWILNCYASMGELSRMTQFKDKSKKQGQTTSVGLFTYPLLMAADILLYKADVVPVGEDQKQHIEIARDIAIRFNNIYGPIFTIPKAHIPPIGGRIMSLQEPDKKMSKSDANPNNILSLLDPPAVITQKIMRAVTDSEAIVTFDSEKKPGVANLLSIFSAVTNTPIAALETEYKNTGYGRLKKDLAQSLIEFLAPIQKRHQELRQDLNYLHKVLRHGAEAATVKATPMLDKVHEAVGFIPM